MIILDKIIFMIWWYIEHYKFRAVYPFSINVWNKLKMLEPGWWIRMDTTRIRPSRKKNPIRIQPLRKKTQSGSETWEKSIQILPNKIHPYLRFTVSVRRSVGPSLTLNILGLNSKAKPLITHLYGPNKHIQFV